MPQIHEIAPDGLVSKATKGLAVLGSRIQVRENSIAVYIVPGGLCTPDAMATIKPNFWRFYDRRETGSYVDIDANDLTIHSINQSEQEVADFLNELAVIEKRSRLVKEDVTFRILEIPALKILAFWELRNGASYSFHVYGFDDSVFLEEPSSIFFERVAIEWGQTMRLYAQGSKSDELGG